MITITKELERYSKNCLLNIYLLNNSCSYSIYFPNKKKHLYFDNISDKQYGSLLENFQKLNANILQKSKLLVKAEKISLIPEDLFNIQDLNVYSITILNQPQQKVWYTHIKQINAYLIYTISDELLITIKNYFNEIEIFPIDKIILSAISNYKKYSNTLLLNIEANFINATYISNKKLNFYNSIPYSNKDDLIKSLLTISQILNINRDKTQVIISGQIDSKSDSIKEICSYFYKVDLAKLPDVLNFDPSMKHIPQHYFYNLFTAPLCE